jgi:outer membrane protein assembly factor BamB
LYGEVLFVPTHTGELYALDRTSGAVLWQKRLPGPVWSSPVVVDTTLLQGDCDGVLHAYDVTDPRIDPPERWSVRVGGCIESTPAVWKGRIYVGTRSGRFHAIGDA